MIFWSHFACSFQASAKSAKPQKYQFRLGKIDIFKGSSIEKTWKRNKKSIKNEGAKKRAQNALQKSILGPIFGSKTLPKTTQRPLKSMLKIKARKNIEKSANKNLRKYLS